MLTKFLSNINASNKASGDGVLGDTEKSGKTSSTEQIFKSLLQSLQNEGDLDNAKQQLLTLSNESSEEQESVEGENKQSNILGGSFTMVGEKVAEDLEQADQNVLKELQKEFQNIKDELIANSEKAKDSESESTEGEAVIEDSNTEETESKENKNSDSEKAESKPKEGSTQTGAEVQEGNVRVKGESENIDEKNKSAKQGKRSKSKITDGQRLTEHETSSKQDSKVVDKNEEGKIRTDGAKNLEGGKQGNSENATTKKNDGKSESSQLKNNKALKTGSEDEKNISLSSQNKAVPALGEEQIDADKTEESQNKNSEEVETGKRITNNERQAARLENTAKFVDRDMRFDALQRPKKGQVTTENNSKAGATQTILPMDGTKTAKAELNEQQKKVMNSFFQKDNSANISTKGLEVKGVQSEKGKKSSNNKADSERKIGALGKQSSEGRDKILSRLGLSHSKAHKELKPLSLQNFSGISLSESNGSLKEQKSSWEEQINQTLESGGEKESKGSSGAGSMRLGQMPVTNASLRKKILPGLTQNIQKAASSAKENPGDWQKHSFKLDDSKSIQLSVRESKGVLQVKVGSMNLDLSKLLQQNLQQIREHLKQEFGSDIDLQFENQQSGEESQFSENTEQSNRRRNYRNSFAGEGLATEEVDGEHARTVRNFGYNQMEWTA